MVNYALSITIIDHAVKYFYVVSRGTFRGLPEWYSARVFALRLGNI